MANSESVEFCGEIRHETTKAFLVFDGANEIWLPKSKIVSYRKVGSQGDDFEFVIPQWLAEQKEII